MTSIERHRNRSAIRLVAMVAVASIPGTSEAGLFHRADPGRPLPMTRSILIEPPHPLPGGTWIMAGGRLNPAGAVPIELTSRQLYVPSQRLLAETWVLRTWRCPQVLGSEPWDGLELLQYDPAGTPIARSIAELQAAAFGRTVVVLVHGNNNAGRVGENECLYALGWLDGQGVLPPDALFVLFDWPSYRVIPIDPLDINEKGRRGFVAGYHLARLLQALPAGTRVGLVGHSLGGRAVLSAMHLLGGGRLTSPDPSPTVTLPDGWPCDHLRLRVVLIGDANDHHWAVPGKRLGNALLPIEGLLSLHNTIDESLLLYPLSVQSGRHHALGRVGLQDRDRRRLGPLAAKVQTFDLAPFVGPIHTMPGAVAFGPVALRIAPYLFAWPD